MSYWNVSWGRLQVTIILTQLQRGERVRQDRDHKKLKSCVQNIIQHRLIHFTSLLHEHNNAEKMVILTIDRCQRHYCCCVHTSCFHLQILDTDYNSSQLSVPPMSLRMGSYNPCSIHGRNMRGNSIIVFSVEQLILCHKNCAMQSSYDFALGSYVQSSNSSEPKENKTILLSFQKFLDKVKVSIENIKA